MNTGLRFSRNAAAGKLRALAIGSAKRAPSVPDVPTTALQGATTVGSTSEQFAAHLKAEVEKWAQVGKAGVSNCSDLHEAGPAPPGKIRNTASRVERIKRHWILSVI